MSRVTVQNPFDLLVDENEDAPKQKPAAPAKPAAKPAAAAQAAKPAAAKPAAPKPEAAKAPAKPVEAKAAPKQAGGNSANQIVKPAPVRDSNQSLQEVSREPRPPRDKRDHPSHPPSDRKREYDRKSGTGRPQTEVKKGGQGKGNWGGEVDVKEGTEALKEKEEKAEKEEADDQEKPAAEGEKKEGDAAKDTEAAVAAAAAAKEAEEMTLEEYQAKQKAKAPKIEALKPRTVVAFDEEGLVALEREDDKDKKKDKKEKPAAPAAPAGEKKEKKENLAAKIFKFASKEDENRRGRGRGYDGENRGPERRGPPRGRGGPRPDARQQQQQQQQGSPTQPPVQEKDFPALSLHGSDPVRA